MIKFMILLDKSELLMLKMQFPFSSCVLKFTENINDREIYIKGILHLRQEIYISTGSIMKITAVVCRLSIRSIDYKQKCVFQWIFWKWQLMKPNIVNDVTIHFALPINL
ncbi:hypothetical protein MCFN_00180 [Mycoplasmopsis californica]|uniref:Uncharacterized protein n=1 Tax=Mycoplasmopsis californica TaxID=2113 RepID=A0A059XQB7_9BACT|nr:hypothetical protein MCFN_00180 [Mycoplasmopsis californica]